MSKSLFPTFPEVRIYDVAIPSDTTEYQPAYSFDFSKGDFMLDGAGRMIICDGVEAWKQWCIKMLMTQRMAFGAYDDEMGIEGEEALQEPSREAFQSHYEQTVRRALKIHPCTENVKNFTYLYENNAVNLTFVVDGINSASFTYEANYVF